MQPFKVFHCPLKSIYLGWFQINCYGIIISPVFLVFFGWCYTCQLIANAKGSLHEYICIYSIIYTPHHRADTTLSVSTICTRCLSQVSIYSSYLHEFSKHCINIIVTVRPNHFILSDSTLFPHPSLYFFYVSLRQWNIHDSLFHRPYIVLTVCSID